MRKFNLKISILIISLIVISQSSFADTLLLTVRNGEGSLNKYCQSKKCNFKILENDSKEFANGNTFVRFKQSVAQQDILIVIPSILDFNQYLELLIKVRTAKAEFASSVKIVTDSTSNEITVTDIDGKSILSSDLSLDLLAEAGVDRLNGIKIQPAKIPRFSKTQRSVVVDQGTNTKLAVDIAKSLNLPVISFNQAQADLKDKSYNVILISSVAEPHNLNFLNSLEQVRVMKKLGSRVTLVSPYLPYARSDKKDQNGVSVIGRLAADIIERSGVDSVQFVRAHAPQSQGFFRIPSIQTMGRKTINTYLASQGVEQVVSPDAGFQKDATLYADDLAVPVSVINKQRDLQTGESKLHDMSGPNVLNMTVAIIDDETASGGTLGKAAEFLKKQGAKKVIAVVTHLAGNASQAINSPYIDQIAVTDTFEVGINNPKLKVLSIANEISFDLKIMLGIAPNCSKAYRE